MGAILEVKSSRELATASEAKRNCARATEVLQGEDQDGAGFYADHLLTQAPALRNAIVHGAVGVMALGEEQF